MQSERSTTADRGAEIKRQIEIANSVLWETRNGGGWNWLRDYIWLQDERTRLVRELCELEGEAKL
jgi:hypothetical protein